MSKEYMGSFDVVVIGASLAGFTAAVTLAKKQVKVALFHADDRPEARSAMVRPVNEQHLQGIIDATKDRLKEYPSLIWIEQEAHSVQAVGDEGNFFVVTTQNSFVSSTKLILAMESKETLARMDGSEESASYALSEMYRSLNRALTDATGTEVHALAASGNKGDKDNLIKMALCSLRFCQEVYIFTRGNPALAKELADFAEENRVTIDDREIKKVEIKPPTEGELGRQSVTFHFEENAPGMEFEEARQIHDPFTEPGYPCQQEFEFFTRRQPHDKPKLSNLSKLFLKLHSLTSKSRKSSQLGGSGGPGNTTKRIEKQLRLQTFPCGSIRACTCSSYETSRRGIFAAGDRTTEFPDRVHILTSGYDAAMAAAKQLGEDNAKELGAAEENR